MPSDRDAELVALGGAFRVLFRDLIRMRGRDTHLPGSQLSYAQFELLVELDERGELSASELACAAQLSGATVTQMLDSLATSGHVERVRSDSDRRVVVSRLTEEGRAKVEIKRVAWKDKWERALGDLDVADLAAAKRVMERLSKVYVTGQPSG